MMLRRCIFSLLFSVNLLTFAESQVEQNSIQWGGKDTSEVNFQLNRFDELIFLDADAAKPHLDTAFALSKKMDYQKGIAMSYKGYGFYFNQKGEFPLSKEMTEKARALFLKLGLILELAECINEQAISSAEIGNYDEALTHFHEAGLAYTKCGNLEGQANVYSNIGMLNTLLQKWETAKKYYEYSLDIFQRIGEKERTIYCLTGLANIYSQMDDFNLAIEFSNKALTTAFEFNDLQKISSCYHNLGTFYDRIDVPDSAAKYWQKALDGYKQLELPSAISSIQLNIANYAQRKGDYNEAISLINSSLDIAQKTRIKKTMMEGYGLLMEIYKKKGEYKKSLECAEFFILFKDSLQGENMKWKISEIESNFETEKKEKEINFLKEKDKVNQLEIEQNKSSLKIRTYFVVTLFLALILLLSAGYFLRKQNKLKQQKTAAELEQRAFRAQMNPHFIFNSLNSIQRMYIEGENDKANDYTADFAQLMRKILENSDKNKITLEEEITTLKLYLELEKLRCKGQIDYEIQLEKDVDTKNTFVPPLILQPFVENAIWHGILPRKEKGTVRVEIKTEGNKLKCIISDDGVGIDLLKSAKHESKGIHITEQRIGNKVEVKSVQGKGTTVSFYI